ncbi:MAG: iron uptake porin, partial [Synechococcaceae cyanobacterium]|nr:iron uptake porin [Synechococcaceae cyanobacterium]
VTSISQFGDVKPTDWAYQALSNLIERYGCVAGYPDGTYKGGRAMTRFEAAALLNACLDRVTEVTDELKRLMAEFEKELAILKGRVDGLEAKVGELEANQFSTTTKLSGVATFVIGGASNTNPGGDGFDAGNNKVTFNYDVKLNLDTSFTGKDLLRTQLRSGNAGTSIFNPGTNFNSGLEVFTDQCAGNNGGNGCNDGVNINRLFYKFPIGESFTATVGAKVRQDDLLALWPSVYPSDSILDIFTYAGARGVYSLNLGAGVGLSWAKNGWSISANYVSVDADSANSAIGVGEGLTATAQVGYAASNWGAAFAYTYTDFGGSSIFAPLGFGNVSGNSVGLSGYWQPSTASWVPSISTGFSYSATNNGFGGAGDLDAWTWMVGLQWADAFIKGNALGMAIGSAGSVGGIFPTGGFLVEGNGTQDTVAYELWYKFQVTDNISVTPAFFWIQNDSVNGFAGQDTFGGLLKTTFKF